MAAPQYQPRLEIKSSIFGTPEEEEGGGVRWMEERDQGIKSKPFNNFFYLVERSV